MSKVLHLSDTVDKIVIFQEERMKRFKTIDRAEKQRFTIKKYSFGAASVLIGVTFLLSASQVGAQEIGSSQANNLAVSQTMTETNQEPSTDLAQTENTANLEPAESASQDAHEASQQQSQAQAESQAALSEATSEAHSDANAQEQSEAVTASVSQPVSDSAIVRRSVAKTATQAAQSREVTTVTETDKGFSLQYNGQIAKGEQIEFAVWSERQGQDDLIWYKADATGAAFIDLSKHREYGKYNIHTYSAIAGRMIGRNASTYTVEVPQVEAKIEKTAHNTYQVTISNVPNSITEISLPTWSEANGQDDIKWYQTSKGANHTYTATIKTPEFGHYAIHVYGKSSITGGTIGLLTTPGLTNTDTREKAKVSVEGYAKDKTSLTVKVDGTNAKTIKSVSIAAWSDKNGQDDLKWYTQVPTNNSVSQLVSIKDLSNTSDIYHIHAYTYYADGTVDGRILGDFNIQKPVERNQVTVDMTENGLAISLNSNTVSDYRQVRFAVWSDAKGQDDLKWYNADASGKVTAPYKNHKDFGKYNIHTYLSTAKGLVGLNASTYTLAAPSVKSEIKKIDEVTYDVLINQVPAYIAKVSVPVWSDKNGQDDIKWLQASKQSDGSYKARILLKEHNFDSGRYLAHIYGTSKLAGNSSIALGTTAGFTVAKGDIKLEGPQITVSNYKKEQGHLELDITETAKSKTIKQVKVAAWSQKNQENLKWYTVTLTKGQAKVAIDQRKHNYLAGDYTVHAYIDYQDGTSEAKVVGTYKLDKTEYVPYIESEYAGTGTYKLTIGDVVKSDKIDVAVWSDKNGQDDIIWYAATKKDAHTWELLLDSKKHKDTGLYHIHVYQSGQALATEQIQIDRNNFDISYYSQRDPKWASRVFGGQYFGPTGCVPTTLAMAFQALSGKTYTPIQVGEYLHNGAHKFNWGGAGTPSSGIFAAADHFGFKATGLQSYDDLVKTLASGYYVLGAVQNNIFVRNGTHELLLSGYSNGKTYVHDPHTPALNGWYSIRALFNEQSHDPGDNQGVKIPFIKISDK